MQQLGAIPSQQEENEIMNDDKYKFNIGRYECIAVSVPEAVMVKILT